MNLIVLIHKYLCVSKKKIVLIHFEFVCFGTPLSSVGTIAHKTNQVLMSYFPNCFHLNFKLFLCLTPEENNVLPSFANIIFYFEQPFTRFIYYI